MFIHGGGWVQGTKEASVLQGVLPYLAMGYSVVNVEYRLANVSLAPAAIEDCRCALRWVVAHAKDNNFDTSRIVVAGASAGGHLALTTGMIPTSAGFDRSCQTQEEPRVAAIVNFFGIADVADLLDGPNKKPFPETWPYTVQWLGNQPNRADVARAASPLTYVRPGAADDLHSRRRRSARALQPFGAVAGTAREGGRYPRVRHRAGRRPRQLPAGSMAAGVCGD